MSLAEIRDKATKINALLADHAAVSNAVTRWETTSKSKSGSYDVGIFINDAAGLTNVKMRNEKFQSAILEFLKQTQADLEQEIEANA